MKKPQTYTGWGFIELYRKFLDYLMVPRARVELARTQGPRDFKSRVSTNSTTQARCRFFTILLIFLSIDKNRRF